jgi:hypothetical protein
MGVRGKPRMYLSLVGFLYLPLWTFQLWPPDASAPTDASRTLPSAPTDASRTLAAEVGTLWAGNEDRKFSLNADIHVTFQGSFTFANLWHGTHGFTFLPKEGVLRIFLSLKIRRLRPGLNPRTWVPEASTLTPRPPNPLYCIVCSMLNSFFSLNSHSKGTTSVCYTILDILLFLWPHRILYREPLRGSLTW